MNAVKFGSLTSLIFYSEDGLKLNPTVSTGTATKRWKRLPFGGYHVLRRRLFGDVYDDKDPIPDQVALKVKKKSSRGKLRGKLPQL
jgi:hypothetical protein